MVVVLLGLWWSKRKWGNYSGDGGKGGFTGAILFGL